MFDLGFDAEETDFTSALPAQCCCFAARLAFFTSGTRKLLPYCSFSPLIFYCKGILRHPLFNRITLFTPNRLSHSPGESLCSLQNLYNLFL